MKKLNNYTLLNEETLLSTANGYVGMRANFEESYNNGYKSIIGTYINGFYDETKICYGEKCYGFPLHAQKMINVHNAQGIWIYIEGQSFNIFEGKLKDIHRKLDIKNGYAIRKVQWQSPKGYNFEITFKRMASFVKLELITIDIEIKSLDYDGEIKIISRIDGAVKNQIDEDDSRAGGNGESMLSLKDIMVEGNFHLLRSDTMHSKLSVATACSYSLDMEFCQKDMHSDACCRLHIEKGEAVRFVKYIAFADSIRHTDVEKAAIATANEAVTNGVDYYYREQKKYLDNFWQYAYIQVDDDNDVEYALNYSVYQLLSSAGRDEYSNIGAKGLSGGGYDGHYFWDTEIYMIPFFTLTMPDIAKNLLKFRYKVLDDSKKRALDMGHTKGAKIPWRTISGSECSSYFPAGSAQYHINADIAYAYIQYYLYTKDIDMLKEFGYEVIFETARIWLEVGNYNQKGKYVINTVTGPDEYTAIINNNYYTNSMAKYHLEWTIKLGEVLSKDDNTAYKALCKRLNITKEEIEQMDAVAQNMLLPFDKSLNIHLQDDCFLDKKEWDFVNTPKENYPLMLHYHPLHIYRHKVLKQADTILSYVLLDDVKDDIMSDSYQYYKKYTTHDSSLSPCVHSMMASRINNPEEAYDFFMSTIRLDLDDINKNTKDGLHIANSGGAYMAMVYGFAGLRIKDNGLHLRPIKPKKWSSYRFSLNIYGQMLKVEVGDEVIISSEEPIEIYVFDTLYLVDNETRISLR